MERNWLRIKDSARAGWRWLSALGRRRNQMGPDGCWGPAILWKGCWQQYSDGLKCDRLPTIKATENTKKAINMFLDYCARVRTQTMDSSIDQVIWCYVDSKILGSTTKVYPEVGLVYTYSFLGMATSQDGMPQCCQSRRSWSILSIWGQLRF